MMFHSQIALNQLVLLERGILHTVNSYSCVTGPVVTLLFTIRSGEDSIRVIEVDGGYHLTSVQAERDELKTVY